MTLKNWVVNLVGALLVCALMVALTFGLAALAVWLIEKVWRQ